MPQARIPLPRGPSLLQNYSTKFSLEKVVSLLEKHVLVTVEGELARKMPVLRMTSPFLTHAEIAGTKKHAFFQRIVTNFSHYCPISRSNLLLVCSLKERSTCLSQRSRKARDRFPVPPSASTADPSGRPYHVETRGIKATRSIQSSGRGPFGALCLSPLLRPARIVRHHAGRYSLYGVWGQGPRRRPKGSWSSRCFLLRPYSLLERFFCVRR